MATRKHVGEDEGEVPAKTSTESAQSGKLQLFLKWCDDNGFCVSKKVKVGKEGSCAQNGMVAVADIEKGETLFVIPRKMLLTPSTCGIAKLLEEGSAELQSSSGWIPLLITLMYEYNNPQSRWRTYLDVCPDFKELTLPMFWTQSEREELLKGTGVIEAVDRDLVNITHDFKKLVQPFIQKHKDVFGPLYDDIEFYKKIVAFVMAYSFTEPVKMDGEEEDEADTVTSPPMMVPLADILNHVAKNNANLEFEKDCLKMVAISDIKKGEEIFNTYGQVANWHLLHMYGFAEPHPNNHYDTVDIPLRLVLDAAKQLDYNTPQLLQDKWAFLQAMDLASDDVFVVGVDGILTEEELYSTLKVLSMTEPTFKEYQEKDGWSDDDSDDEDDESLSFEKMKTLPESWKTILSSCASACLKRYSTSLEENEKTAPSSLPTIHRFAFLTSHGQMKLVQKITECCT
ncbi:N-lysine methyltransferase setd6-like [Haliotis cracherodii]|uniref:N-lysine methyltransferase setd6-like n=1 Tax=Haliotis rufescens TaxID=6454 RepID=UPI001EAFEF74|nr:N-lysine methyltransferase setd6-like [Haliotis rufescens]